MRRFRKILKWILIAAVCLFVVIQVYRPARTNPPVDESQAIEAHTQMTPPVAAILDRSCRDCHSSTTRWPWYSNVAPVSWFVIDHVNHGRSHLNLSDWGQYDQSEAPDQLRGMCREVRAGVMPLNSYLWMHHQAKLSADDVKTLCDWANAERARLVSGGLTSCVVGSSQKNNHQ